MKFVALLILAVPAVAFAQQRQLLPKLEIDYQQGMLPGRDPHLPTIAELSDLRILQNGQMPANPLGINDRALITYLNTGAKIPKEVRMWALASQFGTERLMGREETQRIIDDIDIFPVPPSNSTPDPAPQPTFPNAGPHGAPPTTDQATRIARLGASVGLLVRSQEVLGPAGNAQVYAKHFGRLLNLCPDTPEYDYRFIEESGTGFLISPKHVITAGHCVGIVGEDPRIIFGYTEEAVAASRKKQPGSDWIHFGRNAEICSLKLVAHSNPRANPGKGDWAIYEIVGTPTTRTPLKFNDGPPLKSKDQNLVMIGHPCGFALRTTIRGKIRHEDEKSFWTDLDAFIGNSGSPVFNEATWKVEGILVQGIKDFELVKDLNCNKAVRTSKLGRTEHGQPAGEKVGRIGPIIEAKKNLR